MKAIIAVGVVVVVAVAAVLITGGDEATADEVQFENVSDPGSKPFTTPADVPKSSSKSTAASGSGAASGSPSPSAATPSPESSVPGLAGPTGSTSGASAASGEPTVCDREKLVAELVADPDKLSPWADAVGIEADPQSVAAFIRKLRPVTLTRDIQVTDHFYDDGSAEDFQAILPKGTAALVEDDGTPVARCRSGSPLSKPVKLETKTKCVNCPGNLLPQDSEAGNAPPPDSEAGNAPPPVIQPPPPCDDKCFRPEPDAPPAKPPTAPVTPPTDPIATAKTALEKCRKDKGIGPGRPGTASLEQCKTEYEQARKGCAVNPLNPLCDTSICFEYMTEFDTCGSYIDRGRDTLRACLKRPNNSHSAVERCLKGLDDARARCLDNPEPQCGYHPGGKAIELRKLCAGNGARPECPALQVACAKTKEIELGCERLQYVCQRAPNRPDCKAVSDLRQACAKDPKQPDCQGLMPQGAPGLRQQQPPEVPGGEPEVPGGEPEVPGGDQAPVDPGAGQDPGGDPGGGQAPGADGGQQPEETPPPEGAP